MLMDVSDGHVIDEPVEDLHLPELGAGEEGDGVEDEAEIDVAVLADDDGDPFDDRVADDLPVEVEIATLNDGTSAIGDDAEGVEAATDHGVSFDEGDSSLIDDGRGHAEEGVEQHGDDELGIDPIPREIDDGGYEGLEDAGGEAIDSDDFPPLDGHEGDDDEEIDVGIELPAPLAGG